MSGRFGRSVIRSTVWASGIRNCFTTLSWLRHGERELVAEYCSRETLTDSAVKSSPLWN
jgi:hypothetical protein